MKRTSDDAVIFLDLDGVLIPVLPEVPAGGRGSFSQSAISHLNRITAEGHARIVVSSMWRFFHGWERLCRILRDEGVEGELIGHVALEFPEDDDPSSRGEEILHWIRANGFRGNLAVLDDEPNMAPFAAFHVRPDPATGLTAPDATKALGILNQQRLQNKIREVIVANGVEAPEVNRRMKP